ncbi:hypothetical protein [Sphaerisporangium sp. TRM90804]|uniref:hypothetical protein n=1 Tax=Sphaerisporangium sp. TRM90804 TaxID=3031113 RepID=UPI00244B34EF|nr:hypothetical protein [Sphaerisporangium sp. TRM90804]MDH2426302.1 hypothetical protein [Sphaerisporangium sp. TRM90804]
MNAQIPIAAPFHSASAVSPVPAVPGSRVRAGSRTRAASAAAAASGSNTPWG